MADTQFMFSPETISNSMKVISGRHVQAAASDTIPIQGLRKVLGVVASFETDPALSTDQVTAQVGDQAGTPAAGSIVVKTWKRTASGDCTPIAATAFGQTINYQVFGY